ncbi:MAG: hypothetical protein ACO3TD_06475 [Candidatus Nanopelagicales bacterium]
MGIWKNELLSKWNQIGVKDFLDKINIDFETNFVQTLNGFEGDALYQEHTWAIIQNSAVKQGVLHCYPDALKNPGAIWEEWFFYEDSIRHHILSQTPLEQTQGTWMGELSDKDHPKEVLGITWHYHNDLDLRPFYLR